ncbi:LacI family DNA-binding transcriptional regulator [Planobispora siamensis]|uniref:Alanine racemase n=1 Tax=Planobispora siamensis TaxID=936338 RepID=A0A8J3SCZ1_9ACTN|nr:LacI family DNA-binding transcriptional regulator [Planobispora siamensis]GIH91838.1 alanine racemase [Planobispora siamensis]
MARVTIRQVARHAGVSPALVSGVLNEVPDLRVAPGTAARIRAAAAELGYTPNFMARGLRRRRSETIALVGDTIMTTPFAVRMVEAAQQAVTARGYLLFLVNTGDDPQAERAAIRALYGRHVDGLLYACMYHREVPVPEEITPPAVFLDARPDSARFPSVVPDDHGGARNAVAELAAHGHRRIAFLNDEAGPVAAGLRLRGYREALAEAGIAFDPGLVGHARATPETGEEATARLLDRPGVTALFCFNDRMAIGAYRAIRRRGLRVPEDVSVVGYDDQEFIAAYLDPPLTTVALPYSRMGAWGARTLVDLIEGKVPEQREHTPVLMPCDLVRRSSVGPPPA